jgi:surfactin synthase thioesterase subunit
MPPAVETLAIQYPGRQDRWREPAISDIPTLADQINTQLRMWLDRPAAFFGHSMGATVAFEAARRLEAGGAGPSRLFVSGRSAPSRSQGGAIHLLDDEGLLDEIQQLRGTDMRLLADRELLRLALPALRADYKAVETYSFVAGLPLRCPVIALAGDQDPKVAVKDFEKWAEQTAAGFELHVLSGGHFFITERLQEVVEIVCRRIGVRRPDGSEL